MHESPYASMFPLSLLINMVLPVVEGTPLRAYPEGNVILLVGVLYSLLQYVSYLTGMDV